MDRAAQAVLENLQRRADITLDNREAQVAQAHQVLLEHQDHKVDITQVNRVLQAHQVEQVCKKIKYFREWK